MIENIVIGCGALACRSVETKKTIEYMNEKMRSRFEREPFSYAVMAAFAFPPDQGKKNMPLHARGEDYVAYNKLRLESACVELRNLYPGYKFLPKGNAWPLPAVQAARLAGLGVIGIHGMLILPPPYGSFITIGAILTDLELTAGDESGYCEACGVCLDACPTGAVYLENGRRFEKEKCISYVTQHKPGSLPEMKIEMNGMPDWGCDLCQLACPHNMCFSKLRSNAE